MNEGDSVKFSVDGLPPYKDLSRSIRNPKHPKHDRFVRLRKVAKRAVGKRSFYTGPVELRIEISGVGTEDKTLLDYLSGVCDTIDGSHGFTFHWAPIVILDDSQVQSAHTVRKEGNKPGYTVEVFCR